MIPAVLVEVLTVLFPGDGNMHSVLQKHYRDNDTRKPRKAKRPEGTELLRQAVRQRRGALLNEPPRNTREQPPTVGPTGSVSSRLAYVRLPSRHHSEALPSVSYRPQAF